MTVPHVNPLSEQPGNSRTVTIERSRSPSPSSSSQKGGGERRPASRKRNDRSPTRTSTSPMPPLTARDSPSSKPPPDKRISNEEATPTSSETPVATSSSNQPKTKVLDAPVLLSLPPSQPSESQGLLQPPPPPQPTSRKSLAQRAVPKPSSSKQQQTKPTIGYRGMSTDQFAICLGLGWSPDVIRVEFGIEEQQIIEISRIIGAMQLNEVLALMLTFGQKRFAAGPMMILADLTTECNLEWLFSYLVLAHGDIAGLTALAELLQKKDAQEYPAHLERMTISLYHWIYCSLVFASGLFVGVDKNQPLYDGRQLVAEVAGFLTPNQLADFTLSEVEVLIPILAPVLTPIFGPTGMFRYPTKPVQRSVSKPWVVISTVITNNFQLIKIPARYWRGPIGYIRAKHISMVERGFDEQYAYKDHYKLGVWMSCTLEERQGRLKGLIVPSQVSPVWNPEARVTMGSDMPAETCYHIMELLSDPLGPEWEASRQIIEHENRDNWSRACGL